MITPSKRQIWVLVAIILCIVYLYNYKYVSVGREKSYWRYGTGDTLRDHISEVKLETIEIQSNSTAYTNSTDHINKKIAFCLTGQLSRLELDSKVKNIFAANVVYGHDVDVYMLLDNEVDKVKSTKSLQFVSPFTADAPFKYYNATSLHDYTHNLLDTFTQKHYRNSGDNLIKRGTAHVYVRLEKPTQDKFALFDSMVPVRNVGVGMQRASSLHRFHNIMRQWNGLRDCVNWMQENEYLGKIYYDNIVRLRDDTYAIDEWVLVSPTYDSAFITLKGGGGDDGFNDHNFVIDRRNIKIFKAFSEDYYFNNTLKKYFWGNPEHRILQIVASHEVPVRLVTLCQQPLINVRGLHNLTHWNFHPIYSKTYTNECHRYNANDNCECKQSWLKMMHSGITPINSSW